MRAVSALVVVERPGIAKRMPTVLPVEQVVEEMVWAVEWKAVLKKMRCVLCLLIFEDFRLRHEVGVGATGGRNRDYDVELHRIPKKATEQPASTPRGSAAVALNSRG